MREFGDLFTSRQKLSLLVLTKLISETRSDVQRLLAFGLSKQADFNSSIARWANHMEKSVATWGRHALPMLWDWAEVAPLSSSTGGFSVGLDWIAAAVAYISKNVTQNGQIAISDARELPLPDESCSVFFTDPPYYDAIPYADLSDFFYVWLKRALPGDPTLSTHVEPNGLTPKVAEIVWNQSYKVDGRTKDSAFFEKGSAESFTEGRRLLVPNGIGCVVFAHKTTEGWEALLSGMIQAGWVITASWPVSTEKRDRLIAQNAAALSASVHLVCRPRVMDEIGDWVDVLRELPERVGEWMVRLEQEGIRGADLVFACIGPALEIFSRYSRVETPDGREVPLAEYLEKVWEVVGRAALHQVLGTAEAQVRDGGAGALEEDSRLTALFLWTIRSTAGNNTGETAADSEDEEETDEAEEEEDGGGRKAKGFTLIYDIARRFAQPLGIHLDAWKGRIIDIDKGVVRLLSVRDRARQLFGEAGAAGLADRIERAPETARQLELFPGLPEPANQPRGRRRRFIAASAQAAVTEATTLDRVHTAMLLQSSGRTNALRALLTAEQERGADFVRLSNALSALYPQGSEEKRLLDAMLLALPR